MSSATVFVSPGRKETFLKPFSSLTGPRHRADQVADVHLHDFRSRRACRCSSRPPARASIRCAGLRFFRQPDVLEWRTWCSSSRSRTGRAARRRRTDSRGAPRACSCRTPADGPTERGIVIGSLPPGLKSPNSTSATAWPVFLAEIPALENRRHVLADVVDREWAAVEQQHDDRLAGRDHRLDQFLLPADQIEARCGRPCA